MSVPTTINFAQIKVGDGMTPTEGFTLLCGIETTGFNRTAATRTQAYRDCANPARPPEQTIFVNSVSRQLTGSGVYNQAQAAILNGLFGVKKNYEFLLMDISDAANTPAGTVLEYWKGPGVCTALNMGVQGDGTLSITIDSSGTWTYTAGAPA